MPLSEFYRMAEGKMDAPNAKTTGVSYVPENEFVELVWEDGQVMMQGQNKDKKTPVSSNFQFLTPRGRDRDIGISSATTSKMGKFGGTEFSMSMPNSVPSVEMSLNDQDDDMVPWLNYSIEDPLEQDYCSNLLPEISGVTLNEPSNHHSFSLMDNKGNSPKVSSTSRVSHVFPWTSHQGTTMAPSLASGVSDIVSGNTRNNPPVICGDSRQGQSSSGGVSQMKLQKLDFVPPCTSSNLLNFSHFSRPIIMSRSDNQNGVPNNNLPAELKLKALSCGSQKEIGSHSQSYLMPANVKSQPLITKQLDESRSGEQLDTGCREEAIRNDKAPSLALGSMTAKGLPDIEKRTEPILATSSVCSGNSAERASNDPSSNLKRKRRDTEEFDCQSEDADGESVGVKKAGSSRGGTGSKRSRAAEVHNLSERRRRDRINEKMRALQELIPNCNKSKLAQNLSIHCGTEGRGSDCVSEIPDLPISNHKVDKASMLDEAIEYLKTLQLQVQIMSMGAGLCMPPMMFTAGMQHMHAAHVPHFSHMGLGMGMSMGMGFGMGMFDMNGGSQGRPMIPMQGQRYPSPHISSLSSYPHGSNLQNFFGHPSQGFPMSFPQGGTVPMQGRPPMNPTAIGLNVSSSGPHVEVGNVASNLNSKDLEQNASSQPVQIAENSNSLSQPSSQQFQTENEGADQSSFPVKNDPAVADGGGNTAVITNSNDSLP